MIDRSPELGGETLPIFESLGVDREALASLRIFWQTAERDAATAALGRRILVFLERSRSDR